MYNVTKIRYNLSKIFIECILAQILVR